MTLGAEAKPAGVVYLVGAGPGDPGLITVRGVECLRRAEVVVYDRLADPRLLDHAPSSAERIFVGKASGDHEMPQGEINALLVRRGLEGRVVVRLKGGDPYVFGRGGEEAMDLAAAGVPFEVVPGVSSALAAAAFAGIPVTHRGVATSFTVTTGHRAAGVNGAPGGETLVYLMGVENLPGIVDRLTAQGLAASTPAALVRWGSTHRQQTVVGTLGDIVERARGLQPPAVLIVGQVVALRGRLNWFERRPLFGKRVLVTRSREQAGSLSGLLAGMGAEPVELPLIRVLPPQDPERLDAALARPHDWVVFASANGVRAVWQRLEAAGRDARALAGARICAIGPATAAELAIRGIQADLVPADHASEAITPALGDVRGLRVLLPRADIAPEALAGRLRGAGAVVDDVAAYRTVAVAPDSAEVERVRAELAAGGIDAVTFTSSSTVRAFVAAGLWPNGGSTAIIACIGPVTAATAGECSLPVSVVAGEHTVPGLAAALAEHFRRESEAREEETG